MKILAISITLLAISASSIIAKPDRKPIVRSLHSKSFAGKISLHELPGDKIEVRIRTWRTTRDTIAGHALFPVLVNGHKQDFFFGKFGASKLPVLIFAASEADRINESRVLAYQLSPNGALIGQQVIVDEAIHHGHTDELASGRYALAAVDPKLGAIFSIAYQDAHFENYFVSYEKLRVRQWDAAINAFIETDQGFLRDKYGRLVESGKFHSWPERTREELFTSNLSKLPEYAERPTHSTKIVPVSAQMMKK